MAIIDTYPKVLSYNMYIYEKRCARARARARARVCVCVCVCLSRKLYPFSLKKFIS